MAKNPQLGDLPDDIGSDHNQLIDVPGMKPVSTEPVPSQAKKRIPVSVPGWVRWLANILIPNLLPSLQFVVKTTIVGVNSRQVSNGKSSRRYLIIQNNSPGNIFINFDQEADPLRSIIVVPGGYYEPFRVPQNAIYISAALASSTVVIIEG